MTPKAPTAADITRRTGINLPLCQDGKKQPGILSAFRELIRELSRTSNTDRQVRN